jgi:hypothetical protein
MAADGAPKCRQKVQSTKVVNQERDNGNLAILGKASLIAVNTKAFSHSNMITVDAQDPTKCKISQQHSSKRLTGFTRKQ